MIMNWVGILFSLLLILQFSRIDAENSFDKEISISCVSSKSAKEFTNFHLKYDTMMAKHAFKFHAGEIEAIKKLVGKNDKIIFYFLGHEDFLRKSAGRSFLIAREHMFNTNATCCTVSYEFLCGSGLLKKLQYFSAVENRVPKVVEMASSFIQNIVDSKEFKINLSGVYLTGFCLGGHISGMVGRTLKGIYKGEMVPAIWAFDPPAIAFPHPSEDGNSKRVQKGDGKFVVVFHTSTLGVLDNIADVDVIVNYGRGQPGCNNMFCDHFAAFILHEYISLQSDELPKYAHKYDYSGQFALEITQPPSNKSGLYYLITKNVFGDDK